MSVGEEQLGRYHLVRKLATGGMAEVFLAKVMGPGGFEKSLVIKRILPNLAKDPAFVAMFLQEARLAAQFAHPAVVQIFDFGEVNGSFFLAMEFIDGPTLRNVLRAAPDRRISLGLGARIIEQACEGLAYVHEFTDASGKSLGLMHCDVSTDNMLIARNGAVKVVDFGVAKAAGESNSEPGTVKGKIAYMPPEQIIGEADLRADVYALGVILYELAAGTRPYDSKSDQQLLEAIIKTDPVPLLSRRPDVPREYALLVEKAMAKNLSARFQSCRELAAALDDFISSTGERVGNRQLAALATQFEEAPGPRSSSSGTPVSATPFAKQTSSPPVTPPLGNQVAKVLRAPDPFATFGAVRPSAKKPEPPPSKPDPFAAFGIPRPSSPSSPSSVARPPPAPALPPTARAAKLFNEFFADLDEPTSEPIRGVLQPPVPVRASAPSRAPGPAPAAAQPPPVPTPSPNSPEGRVARVLASATSMRLYEPGAPLATLAELEAVSQELDRDEGLFLLVRFCRNAGRLLKAMDNAESIVAERVAGAVEGLLLAEAYGPLATLLEHLQATAELDAQHRKVFELALAIFATDDQARRVAMRLREAPPLDVEGLSRLLPYFGGALAPAWLTLFEGLDLPASREAVLPGLAGLAAHNAAPFLERLQLKRPRRLSDWVYCLEKGHAAERVRVVPELMARLDASRRREVLMGLARAATDDAFRVLFQALSDEAEETRVLAIQLLGKHFPDRVFQALEPLLTTSSPDTRSEAYRRALWVAVASSNQPSAFQAIVTELSQKSSMLNRARVDARKLDALDGLAVRKEPRAEELMRQLAGDASQGEAVRAAADRHLRAAALIKQTTATYASESRRWERAPGTWRDVLLDLHALAGASRLIDVGSASFDIAFARIASRQAALLTGESQAIITCNPTLMVNGLPVNEGDDPAIDRVHAALRSRSVASFTFLRHAPRADLEQLVRWLAAGPTSEAMETPSIARVLSAQSTPRAGLSPITVPKLGDVSRETMIRYVDLIVAFRGWLEERKLKPLAGMPEVRQTFHELAALVSSRAVRILGLTPRERNRDAELFHSANVMTLALAFGAELSLPPSRLVELASYAFFADVGTLGLKDETFARMERLTEEDQYEVSAARRWSLRLPFVQRGDQPSAVAWATAVLEQDLDWASPEQPGKLGADAAVGLMGSLVALARAYEALTTATAHREAFSRDATLDLLATKGAHRFRPELLTLFVRFIQRQSARPLGT